MRELVDEHDLGPAAQHRVEVHLLEVAAAVLDHLARDDFEVAELLDGARPTVRLHEADNHVGTAVVAAATLVEHRECLPDAGCGAEIHPKIAPGHRATSRLLTEFVQREVELEHVHSLLPQHTQLARPACVGRSRR